MHLAGAQISGERGTGFRVPGAVSALLTLLLLTGALPCGSMSGCNCPCAPQDVPGSRAVAPASCCDGSAGTTLTPALPGKPQHVAAAPAALPVATHGLVPILLHPEAPRFSRPTARLSDPPPLIFLLCTLLI